MKLAAVVKYIGDKLSNVGEFTRKSATEPLEDEDGNVKYFDRTQLPKYVVIFFIAILCGFFTDKYFNKEEIVTGGIDDYNEEISIGTPIQEVKEDNFELRIAKQLNGASGSDYDQLVEKISRQSNNSGSSNLPEPKRILTSDICDKLIKLASTGKKLTTKQKEELDRCINENISGLSDQQLKALKMLLDPNSDLTDKERKLLAQFVNGEITNDDDPRLTLIDGLMSSDPNKRRAARLLINNDNLTDEERAKLMQFLKDEIGLDEVRDILKTKIQGVEDKEVKSTSNSSGGINSIIEEINDLAKKRNKLNKFLNKNRNKYNSIKKKIENGEPVSDEELAFMDRYNKALRDKAKLDRILNSKKNLLRKIQNDYNKSFMDAAKNLNLEGIEGIKIIKHKPNKKYVSNKTKVRLTPYELRKLGLDTRNIDNFKSLDASKIEISTGNTMIASIGESPNLELPSGLKLAAHTSNSIYLKGDNSDYRLEVTLDEDIYDFRTKKRLLPKGALLVGKVNGFDERTKIASAIIDKAIVDGRSFPVKFIVTHANGVPGIPGQVLSNRGEKLAAAVLTDTVSKFAESFVERTEAEVDVSNASLAELGQLFGIQATASTAESIAEFLAKDLEQTPALFLAPPRVKLILITE